MDKQLIHVPGDIRIRDYLALGRCVPIGKAPCAKMLFSRCWHRIISAFQPELFWHRKSHELCP